MERTRRNDGSRLRGGWLALRSSKRRKAWKGRRKMLQKMSYTTLYWRWKKQMGVFMLRDRI